MLWVCLVLFDCLGQGVVQVVLYGQVLLFLVGMKEWLVVVGVVVVFGFQYEVVVVGQELGMLFLGLMGVVYIGFVVYQYDGGGVILEVVSGLGDEDGQFQVVVGVDVVVVVLFYGGYWQFGWCWGQVLQCFVGWFVEVVFGWVLVGQGCYDEVYCVQVVLVVDEVDGVGQFGVDFGLDGFYVGVQLDGVGCICFIVQVEQVLCCGIEDQLVVVVVVFEVEQWFSVLFVGGGVEVEQGCGVVVVVFVQYQVVWFYLVWYGVLVGIVVVVELELLLFLCVVVIELVVVGVEGFEGVGFILLVQYLVYDMVGCFLVEVVCYFGVGVQLGQLYVGGFLFV